MRVRGIDGGEDAGGVDASLVWKLPVAEAVSGVSAHLATRLPDMGRPVPDESQRMELEIEAHCQD